VVRQLKPGYRVTRLGDAILDEDGVDTRRSFGRVEALIKDHDPSTYEIANEYICSRLAMAVGLPVPPGDFAEVHESEKVCWVSPLVTRESPPPPDLEDVCSREPKAAAGMVIFDAWVANHDRHEYNFLYSLRYGLTMIDHGQTLFFKGENPMDGLATTVDVGLGSHLLSPFVSNAIVDDWCSRIAAVPRKSIVGAVEPVQRLNLISAEHGTALVNFIEHRARRLKSLVRALDLPQVTEEPSAASPNSSEAAS
jgi:hypothetical protein